MPRGNPPDHRDPHALDGLRQRRRERGLPTGRIEPFPAGTRVHHRGAIHSVGQDPEHPNGGLRGGWGIVEQSVEQHDGTFEYEVRCDRGIAGGMPAGGTTWWGSHHINRALPSTDG